MAIWRSAIRRVALSPRKSASSGRIWKKTPARACTTRSTAKADSRIDLNRTGTPLLEIVSEPDMRSPLEARAYLTELKLLLTYLGVSDCNMQEGSLRVDANVNLHIPQPDGRLAKTPIVEIKNMNSFRAVERALAYEAQRQYEVWQEDHVEIGKRPKQTRGWDDAADVTRAQRHKEESSDYRYFPEPDLVPVTTTPEKIDKVRCVAGRTAGRICDRGWNRPTESRLRQRRDRESGPAVRGVLRRTGRCGEGRQSGGQLGHARCAAGGERTREVDREFPSPRRGACPI